MKISKGAIITIIFALSILLIVVSAIKEGEPTSYPKLRSYLNNVFNENEYGVSIYTEEGENVTDSFLEENRELYEKGDMDEIVDKFVNSNYILGMKNFSPDDE